MKTFNASAIKLIHVYLPDYRPSEMVPLLKVLLRYYKLQGVPFPCFIWQCCKTNAGLLGFLVEIAHGEKVLFRRVAEFIASSRIRWFQHLRRNAPKYLTLLEKYMRIAIRTPNAIQDVLLVSMEATDMSKEDGELLGNLVRIRKDDRPIIDPAALAVVAYRPPSGEARPLFASLLADVIDSCDMRSVAVTAETERGGASFEMYTLAVIHLRSHALKGQTRCAACWFHASASAALDLTCNDQCKPRYDVTVFGLQEGRVEIGRASCRERV